jgi:hypothetical protein
VKYCLYVKSKACLVCGDPIVDPHHLTFAQPKALGKKVGDQYVVPLCRHHHMHLHVNGVPEKTWWALNGIDPMTWAVKNWKEWEDNDS